MMLQKTDWDQRGSWKVGAEDTEIVARWVFEHMTQKNKKLLGNILNGWFGTKPNREWLNDSVARLWGFVIEDRAKAYNKAAMSGQLGPQARVGPFNRQDHQHAVGATICELIEAGELKPDFLDT